MLRPVQLLTLFLSLTIPQGVKANRLPQAEELPDIEEVLQRAGWTMTPEMSAAYSEPGNIFDENNALLKRGADCFDAQAGPPAAYASMEVNRSLEAGVRMRVLIGGGKAGLGIEKKLVFDTPKHRQIPRLDLQLNTGCWEVFDDLIATGEDISGFYVITESLSAIVQKQECGSFDVKARVFVVSGNAKVQQSCAQTSLEPVAVAYKRVYLSKLMRRPPPQPTANTIESPPVVEHQQAEASVESHFDTIDINTDVQSRLREQRCDEEAQQRSVQVREGRIDTAVLQAQTQAMEVFKRIEDDLEACTQLKRSERGECIQSLSSWMDKAKSMKVSIPAGVELVDTACGKRDAAFEAAERTVESSQVGRAQDILKRLMRTDVAGCGEPGSSLDLMGKISMSEVDRAFRSSPAVQACLSQWRQRHQLDRWQLLLNVRLTVGNDGRVSCAQCLSEHTSIDEPLKACVVDAAYKLRIDVSGGPVNVQYALKAVGR